MVSAVLLGVRASCRLKKRAEMLEAVEIFISAASLEIEFISLPVYEILCKISGFDSCKELDFISFCLAEMEKGEDFRYSWVKGIDLSELPFRRDEKEKLKGLGSLIGTSDIDGQRNMLSLYGSYFSAYRNTAQGEYERYGKTSITLGAVMGMGIFILMM